MQNAADLIKNRRLNKYVFILFMFSVSLLYSFDNFSNEVSLHTEVLNKIISVQNPENITKLIPNYEYSFPIYVEWAIPTDSLRNINSDNVTVYVKGVVVNGTEFAYFRDGSRKTNVSYLILYCNLLRSNSSIACDSGSKLNGDVTLFMYLNSSNLNNTGAVTTDIVFYASLTPFEDFIPIYEQSVSLKNQLDELKTKLNLSDSEIEKTINETEKAISSFHFEEAKSNINHLTMKSGNVLFSFYLFLNQIVSQLSLLFSFIIPTSNYSIPLIFSFIIIVFAFILKLRKISKISIIVLSILTVLLSIFELLAPIVLIGIDIFLVLMILCILYARKEGSKRRFRSSDDYMEPGYEDLFKRRK